VIDMAEGVSFKVILNRDNTCSIELGEWEKLHLIDTLKKAHNTMVKMSKWFDDDSVPMEQKMQYRPMYLELLHTYSFISDLIRKAGITNEELKEALNIPF